MVKVFFSEEVLALDVPRLTAVDPSRTQTAFGSVLIGPPRASFNIVEKSDSVPFVQFSNQINPDVVSLKCPENG